MNIALVAHATTSKDLVRWARGHVSGGNELKGHRLTCTGTTGGRLIDAPGNVARARQRQAAVDTCHVECHKSGPARGRSADGFPA